jgi:DHA1 family inner membrane transport protein
MPLSVFVLAVGAFAICTTEFVIMGLLLEIARDLNVSISGAGFLVTGYALGVVVGAPLLMPFLIRFPRKAALVALTVLFVLGNLACAFAQTYETLMAARVVTAFVQANFFGVGAIVAAKLAPPGRQASAIAAMFLGVTLANVAGAPAGTVIGQEFGWRMTFIAVAGIGVLATVSTALLVPKNVEDEVRPNLRQEIGVLLQPSVLRAMLITTLGFGGIFTVFTYVAPLLTQVTGLSDSAVPGVILLFGVGMVIGNPIGGRLADRSVMQSLRVSMMLLIAALVLVGLSLHSPVMMIAAVFLFGIAGFTTLTPLQMHVVQVASKAPNLASAFNIGAFNLGNAAGAWLGGLAIDSALGPTSVPWVGALITLSGLALTMTVRERRVELASTSS